MLCPTVIPDMEASIPDLLHLNLRIVGALYYYTAQSRCRSSEEVLALRVWMKDVLNVVVNSKKRTSKNIDVTQIQKKKESFIGEECLKLLDGFEKLLDHIYDELLEGEFEDEKDEALRAWKAYRKLWIELSTNLPGEGGQTTAPPSAADKKKKSKTVKKLTKRFLDSFVAVSGESAHASFYVHVAIHHLPEFVAMYGNLMYYRFGNY